MTTISIEIYHFSFQYYNFTFFAIALNELHPSMLETLPPTDSRLRPDIRKLEEGDVGMYLLVHIFLSPF